MDNNEIKLYIGEEVISLLTEKKFQQDWDDLYEKCSWATVFQSRAFISSWYLLYQNVYPPILVISTFDNQLTGIVALTKKGKMIRNAAIEQAEYFSWLSLESNKEELIQQALLKVKIQFPKHNFYFEYVSETAPLDWIKSDYWKKICVLKPFKRPLIKIDTDWTNYKLKKRNRRNEINQLKRMGDFSFQKITTFEQFSSVIDEMILLFDFRKAAVYNRTYFQNDPHRRQFLLDLFQQNLLHVTLLKLNEEIIAAAVNTIEGKVLYSKGINTHASSYSKFSPGTLNLLLLSKLLAEEGYETLDLTPGGEFYKDEFATHYGHVYTLYIGSAIGKVTSNLGTGLSQLIKKNIGNFASKIGLQYSQLKMYRKRKVLFFLDKLKTIRKQKPSILIKSVVGSLSNLITRAVVSSKVRRYISQLNASPIDSTQFEYLQKNRLQDLLAFEPNGTLKSRWQFMRDAMQRLEQGETVYTWCEQNRLMGCVWLNSQTTSSSIGLQLEGFYFHPTSLPKVPQFLKKVLYTVSTDEKEKELYALTDPTDKILQHALINVGFERAV